jgi:hypothetical protein
MIVKYTTHLHTVYETKKKSWQTTNRTRGRKQMTNFRLAMEVNEPRGTTRDISQATVNGVIIQAANRRAGLIQKAFLEQTAPTGRR